MSGYFAAMSRRHGSKPTLALWMLVAVADVAVLAAAAGPLVVLVTLAGLVTVVVGGRALWPSQRRNSSRSLVAAGRNTPQTQVARRRA
jgi:hypothetical protein